MHCHCNECYDVEHERYRRRFKVAAVYQAGKARALKYGCMVEMTLAEFTRWCDVHWNDLCECGAPSTDVDHIHPLKKGGAHAVYNLKRLCSPCNGRKSAWLPGEVRTYPWMKRTVKRA